MLRLKVQNRMPLAAFLSSAAGSPIPSNKQARAYIDQGLCRINGVLARKASQEVLPGDLVEVGELSYEEAACPILYEDDDLLIIDKPPTLTSDQETLSRYIKQPIILVHRLDKTTSGLLLLAKNRDMEIALLELFKTRCIKKEYLALVDGKIAHAKGVIDSPLTIASKSASHVLMKANDKGQKAITHWEKLISCEDASLLRVMPITGKTHQIRVHMQCFNHPILGDVRYAQKYQCPLLVPRPLLHAFRLQFLHPRIKQEIVVQSLPPKDFLEAYNSLFSKPIEGLL